MITATFRYKDSGIVDMLAFPQRPLGLKKEGKRPYSVEFKGTYEHESVDRLKAWMFGDCHRALDPRDRKFVISTGGLPFEVDQPSKQEAVVVGLTM